MGISNPVPRMRVLISAPNGASAVAGAPDFKGIIAAL
jgi:hypothetical protein